MATYPLGAHRFTTQQVGKGGKEGTNFQSTPKSNLEYAQTCSFEGNLPPESAPVQNIASG